jgi:flagellar biosynthesis/type III secretory pathway protein FliH
MILSKYSETISEISLKPMPIQVDIRKTFLYKWGKEEGLKEGLKEGEQRGIEKGKQEGLKEGLRKAILLDIEAKFGISKVRQIKRLLDKMNEIDKLEKVKKELVRAKTWEDFVKSIKNSNLKSKDSNRK